MAIAGQRTAAEHHLAGYRIKPFLREQADLVAQWVANLEDLRWVAPCTSPPLTAEKVLEWHRPSVSPYIFFQPGGTPVGYGELVPSQTRQDEIWVAHVVIDPRRRNAGIGRLFLQALMDIAFENHNAQTVSLSVYEDNAPGRSCYRRCGFRECGERKLRAVWLEDEEPLVDMRVERFEWMARRWKASLARATRGAIWKRHYERYKRLRFEGDPHLRERFGAIMRHFSRDGADAFLAADFGSGAGIMAEAICQRFPNARVIALDADPLEVLMGEEALGESLGQRICFELADLRGTAWALGRKGCFDLGVSALALHWMSRESLRRFYRTMGETLAAHGAFANSDHIPPEGGWSRSLLNLASRGAPRPRRCVGWNEFWQGLKDELGIACLCEEMAGDLAVYEGLEQGQSCRFHHLALQNAGFTKVSEIWRDEGEAVIMGWK